MSTTGRGRHSVLLIFKGRRGRTGHHATCGALPATGPYLWLSRFQGGQAICTDDRSAGLTPQVLRRPSRPPTHRGLALAPTAGYRLARSWAPQPGFRFIPHHQFCLPKMAHLELSIPWHGSTMQPRRPTYLKPRSEHAGAEARRDGACWVPRSRRRRLHERIEGPGLGRHHDPVRSTPRADRRTSSRRSTSDRGASPAPIRFPPDNFKHSLTLFSKSFSSFRRGSGHDEALTLFGAPFQGTWARSAAEDASPDYNSDAEGDRFSSWAIPGSLVVTKGILAGFDNDPSAGSPTETLLRLLLPLNDKVQWTSRDVAGSEPPTSPRFEHFTGPFNRINQVAFLRDISPACSSTHYLGRGEAITGRDHRSCRGTKCTSYERPGPRPYAHEIFRIQKHERASVHRRG
ncbi:hypothetical protein V6N13_023030 [Hibiscus sabdariffa]